MDLSPADSRLKQNRWRRWLLLLIGLALFLLVILIGGKPALEQVGQPEILPLLLGLVATGAMFAASSGRWTHITNALVGRRVIGHLDSFVYFMSSFLLGVLISQSISTVVVRSAALSKAQKVSIGRSVGSVVVDKGLDAIFIALFALPALPFFLGWISLSLALGLSAAAAALAVVLAATQSLRIQRSFDSLLRSLQRSYAGQPAQAADPGEPAGRPGFFRRLATRLRETGPARLLLAQLRKRLDLDALPVTAEPGADQPAAPHILGTLLSPSALVAFCLYSIVKQILLAVRLYFIAQAVGVDVSLGLLFLGVPFAQLSLLIAFTPGALGILELGWYAVFAAAGIDPAATATFVIAQRAYNTLYVIILSGLSYILLWLTRLRQPLPSS